MDFVAIDFETANEQRGSICACGIAVVTNGSLEVSQSWLIKPKEMRFAPINVAIHGIRPNDVMSAPTFEEFWPQLRGILNDQYVLAHNASFDISALRYGLSDFSGSPIDFRYSCTRNIAKKTWPGLINYGLDAVSEFLSIEFEHHDAGEDARACAEVALRAGEIKHAGTIAELVDELNMNAGHMCYDGKACNYSVSHYNGHEYTKPIRDFQPSVDHFDSHHPFYGRRVIFTGTLDSMSRTEAIQKIIDAGGTSGSSVNACTNFLVVGNFNFATLKTALMSSKLCRARELTCNGCDLEIITENDFLRLLQS